MLEIKELVKGACSLKLLEMSRGEHRRLIIGLKVKDGSYVECGALSMNAFSEVEPSVFLAPVVETVRREGWDLVIFTQAMMLLSSIGVETTEEAMRLALLAEENPLGAEARKCNDSLAVAAIGATRCGRSAAACLKVAEVPRMGGPEYLVTDHWYTDELSGSSYKEGADILTEMVKD